MMTRAQLCERIENLDRRVTILKEDYEAVDVLKAYLKCGTIQTITAFNIDDYSWFNIRNKKNKKEQVYSRTVIHITCSDGIYTVDLSSYAEISLQSEYKHNLQKDNPGLLLVYSKGYPKNIQPRTISTEVEIDYLEKAHAYLDSLSTSGYKSIKDVFEVAILQLSQDGLQSSDPSTTSNSAKE